MIPIVEEMIKSVIEKQLKFLKQNPTAIEHIFKYSNTPYGNKFRKFLENNNIRVLFNFPRDGSELPCYCIMLGGEDEEAEALGEYLDDDSSEFSETNRVPVKIQEDTLRPYIKLPKPNIIAVPMIRNLNTGLEIDTVELSAEDSSIILLPRDQEVNDTIEVTSVHMTSAIQHGTMFGTNFKVECWSDNADLTVYMYYALKFIMLSMRPLLIEQGMIKPVLRGLDLEPVPDYFPTFVYRRSMLISGAIENSYSQETIDSMILDIEKVVIEQDFYHADPITLKEGED